MSSKNLDNKRTQSKLTFIKLNNNKKLKQDFAKSVIVANVAETKRKQKETENIMNIDSTTTIFSQPSELPTPSLLGLTNIVTPIANSLLTNWAEKTDKMLVEQTSSIITFTFENTSSLGKNLSAAISCNENTSGTNQNEVLPQDKETSPEEKTFIHVPKVTYFFATVTKIELEGDTTHKQITKLEQYFASTNGFLDVHYILIKKDFTIYYASEYILQKGVNFLKKQYTLADIIIGNSKHDRQKEADRTMVIRDISLNIKSEILKQYFTQYGIIIRFSMTTISL